MERQSTAVCALHRVLRTRPLDDVAERLLVVAGRSWPQSRAVRALTWHLWTSHGERGHLRQRLARVPGGAKLAVTLGDYSWAQIYFQGSTERPDRWLYESETTEFLRRWLRPGDTFVDVGANVGYFVAVAASEVGASGAVHAFEPHPAVADLLRETLSVNGFGDYVHLNEMAVASKTGSVELHLPKNLLNMGVSSIVGTQLSTPDALVSVPATSLDDYVETRSLRRVRLVKIDVEGAELEVLRGASRTLGAGRVDGLLCEFQPDFYDDIQGAWSELLGQLGQYGYTPHLLATGGELIAAGDRPPDWESGIWGNICFLKEPSK